jgi:holin-like protein
MPFTSRPSLRRLALLCGVPLQIGAVALIWWGSEALVRAARLPLPGSVLGLFLLLGLLATGRMPVRMLRSGSQALLSHLILFFVPPMLALFDHPELLSAVGLKLVAAVVVGTVVVMGGTALAVDLQLRRGAGRAA